MARRDQPVGSVPPTPPTAVTGALPRWGATYRYCAALTRFGLDPVRCLQGVGARYDAGLTRQVEAIRHDR